VLVWTPAEEGGGNRGSMLLTLSGLSDSRLALNRPEHSSIGAFRHGFVHRMVENLVRGHYRHHRSKMVAFHSSYLPIKNFISLVTVACPEVPEYNYWGVFSLRRPPRCRTRGSRNLRCPVHDTFPRTPKKEFQSCPVRFQLNIEPNIYVRRKNSFFHQSGIRLSNIFAVFHRPLSAL